MIRFKTLSPSAIAKLAFPEGIADVNEIQDEKTLIIQAQQRIEQCESPQMKILVRKYKSAFNINAEAELALKLLRANHVQELLSEHEDTISLMKRNPDSNAL